jgi:5-methyltetrahydropteroyltriglutamate--homocysteine methyltransferase
MELVTLFRLQTSPDMLRKNLQWKYNEAEDWDMFTATADLILPSTTTGSFPRPRWYDVGMWGRPLDTCMLDIRFREKFQDAMAVVIKDQERAGLDIPSHGDLHVHEHLAGRAWQ